MSITVHDAQSAPADTGEAVFIAKNGETRGEFGSRLVVVEAYDNRLHYSPEAMGALRLELARLCIVDKLNPLEHIEGNVRGHSMPTLRQDVARVIEALKPKQKRLY